MGTTADNPPLPRPPADPPGGRPDAGAAANGDAARRRWVPALAGIVALALGLRIAYALGSHRVFGDNAWYDQVANDLAHGHFFHNPFRSGFGLVAPTLGHGPATAFHPPLFPLVLSAVSLVGGTSYRAHQIAGCAMGAGTVALVGLLARRLAGDRAGLLAAGLAALSPALIGNDSVLLSEPLYGLLIAATLLVAVGALERPGAARMMVLGAGIGLCALTRGEALLLLPLLALPLAWRARERRVARLGAAVLACAVVVAPWAIRNTVTFDHLVVTTTGDGATIEGANAPTTYRGPLTGYWNFLETTRFATTGNEAEDSARARGRGVRYARGHLGRIPVVAAIRVLRTGGIWRPRQQARLDRDVNGHILFWETPALIFSLAAAALGAFALVRERKRIPHLWVLLVPVALVAITSVLTYGQPRFRHAADVALAALAGIAVDGILRRRREGRGVERDERRPLGASAS